MKTNYQRLIPHLSLSPNHCQSIHYSLCMFSYTLMHLESALVARKLGFSVTVAYRWSGIHGIYWKKLKIVIEENTQLVKETSDVMKAYHK